jgi:hypothetical protein
LKLLYDLIAFILWSFVRIFRVFLTLGAIQLFVPTGTFKP